MFIINELNYKYDGQYYFQVDYNRSIKMKDLSLIDRLKKGGCITSETLQQILSENGFLSESIEFLVKNNILISEDDHKDTMINMLTKLLNLIDYAEESTINSIFVYSHNYGYRSVNMVLSAIEQGICFEIQRQSATEMTIKFESGYVYDINTKYNIFGEDLTGCNITMSKSLTNYLLASHGIHVPKQKIFFTQDLKGLDEFISDIQYPICIKPDKLTESKDVFPHVANKDELERVINYYKPLYEEFVVEKTHFGNTYRLYYCYGEVLGAIQKCVRFVVGDGINTVESLINKKYENTMLKGFTEECSLFLDRERLSKTIVLPQGERLNVSEAGTDSDFEYVMLEDIDPCYIELASKVAKAIGIRNFGIDLLADSIKEVKGQPIIIELQESPEFGRGNKFVNRYYNKVVQSICISYLKINY